SRRCPAARRERRGPAHQTSQQLEDGGVGLATALAHRLEAVLNSLVPHVVQHRGHEAGAGTRERVTKCDRAAVGVELLLVSADVLQPGQRHRSERLVDLEHADVVDRQARLLQRLLGGRIGAVSMITGSAPASVAVCTLAIGLSPNDFAFSADMNSSAAEPSEIWLEFPAWITPSSLK